MQVLDAAEAVLKQAGKPLHYEDIAQRMLDSSLWQTQRAAPQATVSARLSQDIASLGPTSRFQRIQRGVFALRTWGLSDPTSHPNGNGSGSPLPRQHNAPTSLLPLRNKAIPPKMSFVDATEHVLAHFADKKPMHYRDITREVLERGFVETVSKNPEITLNAAVVNEIIRQSRQGQPQRFVQHGRGYIGLAKWEEVEAGLAVLIKSHNADIRKKIRAKLHALPPDDFESLIGQLLTAMGFVDVVVTGQSGDGGIDVRGTLVVGDVIRVPLVVQVKRWKQNEQAPTVRDARGALGNDEHGLIITTSDFSSGAREEAVALRKASIWLMNGEQLVALLVEHGVGVRRTSYDLLELGDVELQ